MTPKERRILFQLLEETARRAYNSGREHEAAGKTAPKPEHFKLKAASKLFIENLLKTR